MVELRRGGRNSNVQLDGERKRGTATLYVQHYDDNIRIQSILCCVPRYTKIKNHIITQGIISEILQRYSSLYRRTYNLSLFPHLSSPHLCSHFCLPVTQSHPSQRSP